MFAEYVTLILKKKQQKTLKIKNKTKLIFLYFVKLKLSIDE